MKVGCVAVAASGVGRSKSLTQGAAQTVVSALNEHLDVAFLQEAGFRALSSVAAEKKGRNLANGAGATEAVVAGMARHPFDIAVLSTGCGALAVLAREAPEPRARFAASALVGIVRKNLSTDAVLSAAFVALRDLCNSNEGLEAAAMSGAQEVLCDFAAVSSASSDLHELANSLETRLLSTHACVATALRTSLTSRTSVADNGHASDRTATVASVIMPTTKNGKNDGVAGSALPPTATGCGNDSGGDDASHRERTPLATSTAPPVAESAATAMDAIIADTTEARGSDKKDDNGDASESGAANSLVGNGSDEGDDGHVGKGSGCGSWGSEREACVNLSHAIAVSRDGVSSGGMQTDTCTCGHCEDAKPKRCAVCLKSAVNPSIANKDEANTVGEGSSGSRDGGNGCGNGVGDGGNGVVGGGTLVGAVANVVGSAAPQSERQPMQKATPVVDPALQKGRKSKGSEIRSSSSIGRGYLNAIKRDKDIPRTPR
eukprot:TRINITY_DN18365_c0_g1_i3.p1 TRINITY_DN18365_c0_g1~~TRINITY_DN18365_c0_g1_i3.p1  ORF type:complete len:511 (-),score=86.62 TRINITY_DN18365_c0_g1_i3:252-1718(-)